MTHRTPPHQHTDNLHDNLPPHTDQLPPKQLSLFDDAEDLTPFVTKHSDQLSEQPSSSLSSSSPPSNHTPHLTTPDSHAAFDTPNSQQSNLSQPISDPQPSAPQVNGPQPSAPQVNDPQPSAPQVNDPQPLAPQPQVANFPSRENKQEADVIKATSSVPDGSSKCTDRSQWPEGFATTGHLQKVPPAKLVTRQIPLFALPDPQRPQVKLLDVPSNVTTHSNVSNTSLDFERIETDDQQTLNQSCNTSPDLFGDLSTISVHSIPEKWPLINGEELTLMPHQRVGVAWLRKRVDEDYGAILADDMGLGKTVQVCVLLRILFQEKLASRVLILCPKSVMTQWEEHIENMCHKKIGVFQFHGPRKFRILDEFHDEIGPRRRILLTTYETFRSNDADLIQPSRENPRWDMWIADEATAMKNPSSSNWHAASGIRSRWRLMLTGTPIMNNYVELWALVDLAQPGLLEDLGKFKRKYAILIDRKGRAGDIRRQQLVKVLRSIVLPFLLRRTKKDVFAPSASSSNRQSEDGDGEAEADTQSGEDTVTPAHTLPPKTDLIIFQEMSELQIQIYEGVRSRLDLKNLGNVLTNINRLLSLCRHPVLLLPPERQTWRVDLPNRRNNFLDQIPTKFDDDESSPNSDPSEGPRVNESELMRIERMVDQSSAEEMRKVCPKFEALFRLLPTLIGQGHKVLVFSKSTQTLDLIEACVLDEMEELDYARIDGQVEKTGRDYALRTFKDDDRCRVMLVSTRAGGLGLNLTTADRVVIFDPNWNPALDNQAVDRAHRIGQTQPVTVFRFIFGGAIEDNMLRVQLGKMDMSSSVLAGTGLKSWLDRSDLHNLFSLTRAAESPLNKLLASKTENIHHLRQWVDEELVSNANEVLMAVGIFSMDDVIREIEEYKKSKKQSRERAIWGTQV